VGEGRKHPTRKENRCRKEGKGCCDTGFSASKKEARGSGGRGWETSPQSDFLWHEKRQGRNPKKKTTRQVSARPRTRDHNLKEKQQTRGERDRQCFSEQNFCLCQTKTNRKERGSARGPKVKCNVAGWARWRQDNVGPWTHNFKG